MSHHTLALTYFSIAALVVFLFATVMAVMLLRVKHRSTNTLHLGLLFLFIGLMGLAYFYGQSVAQPAGAYHRWLTVFAVFAGMSHATAFFFYFPQPRAVKFGIGILIAQHMAGLIASVVFIVKTLSVGTSYRFEGHYFDFDAEELSTVIAIQIQLYMLIYVIAGIWRTIANKGKDRWVTLAILLSMMAMTLAPGVTNTLSRDGAISRDFHQTLWCMAVVVFGFVAVMIFVNNTKDRTTFMSKIVGTSLVAILVILQVLSLVVLSSMEDAFDDRYRMTAARILRDPEFRPPELRYTAVFDIAKSDLSVARYGPTEGVDVPITEIENTAVREAIGALASLPPEKFLPALEVVLGKAHPQFAGYAAFIRTIAKSMKAGPPGSAQTILDALDRVERPVLHRHIKLGRIKDEKFLSSAESWAKNPETKLADFGGAIGFFLSTARLDTYDVKSEVLRYLAPAHAAGHRAYRQDPAGGMQYVAFMEVRGDRVYEVGFDYNAYRAYVHPVSLKFSLMILGAVLVIIFGFQLFFLGNLINPLQVLLEGVREVNKGDLEVVVPISVQDEIGYLAKSFNRMVKSIKGAKIRLQEYANGLEEKVKERTKELSETLAEVQNLKTQQDGDYFLTSLLIKPLGANRAHSETVNVDFFVKQKKHFEFRKWSEEIGGDLCIARPVRLRGNNHTVFLNADAMGKSMQGAGGALVLGAVFQTIVDRSMREEQGAEEYPELWIKNAFIELQRVFESFDGSMLVSMVLGMVDEVTGLMYYINAEHPMSVLYRDGSAEFLEKDLHFRKLGTQGLKGSIFVQTYQMQPGDVIIAGSDGRDDILIGHKEDGERIINEDETLFLGAVENAGGDLPLIYDELLRRGELTDDLSLVRVGYREAHPPLHEEPIQENLAAIFRAVQAARVSGDLTAEILHLEKAFEADNHRPEVLRALAKACFKNRQYDKAAQYAEDYAVLRPGETQYLSIASVSYKRLGEYVIAADLGERVRLREPKAVDNLLNLAELYLAMGNVVRARSMLDQTDAIEPGNAKADKIRSRLGG